MVLIKFDTNNDAFSEYPSDEICRILDYIKDQVENSNNRDIGGGVFDINGNKIGNFHVEIE